MKAIVSAPGKGKTTKLMAWLMESPEHVLIVFSAQEKERILKEFGKEELSQNIVPEWASRVVTTFEIDQNKGHYTGKEIFAIDNVDMLLSRLLRRPVQIVSFTGEVELLGQEEEVVEEVPQETDNNQPQQ